jgi:hypothetical protein
VKSFMEHTVPNLTADDRLVGIDQQWLVRVG